MPPHLDPRGRGSAPTRRDSGKRVRWARIVSGLLSATIIAGFGYGWKNYRDLNNGLQRLAIHTGTQNGSDIDGRDQNLLIVGNDDRTDMTRAEARALHTGRGQGSISTDTMMIVHVPADGSKATLISLPRDSYVAIPGHGMNKLNSAYAAAYTHTTGNLNARRAAGADLLIKTISHLTGLTIDHFVQVGLLGFYRISNAIGGVTVDLCRAVNDSYSGLRLSAGKHIIQGVTALAFVRQRHGLTNGDIDRTQRQRYFLTAAFRKIASAGTLLNPGRLHDLVRAVDTSLYVDSGANIGNLGAQMADLSANNIVGRAIPFQGFDNNSPVGSVVLVDPARVRKFVNALIGSGNSALANATPVDPSTVTVSVLNGGAANGAAGRAAATLRSAGFTATPGDSTAPSATTIIEYAGGQEAQAKTLARYVPGAVLRSGSVSAVTLVLGSDGLHAQSSAAAAPKHQALPKKRAVDAGCIN